MSHKLDDFDPYFFGLFLRLTAVLNTLSQCSGDKPLASWYVLRTPHSISALVNALAHFDSAINNNVAAITSHAVLFDISIIFPIKNPLSKTLAGLWWWVLEAENFRYENLVILSLSRW